MMKIANPERLKPYTKLVHFLTLELPQIAKRKRVMDAYILMGATHGATQSAKDDVLAFAKTLATLSLSGGFGPKVDVGTYRECNDKGLCKETSAVYYMPPTDTIAFDETLAKGYEFNHGAASLILEVVVMHELTHWLDCKIYGPPHMDDKVEVGDALEALAFEKMDLGMRKTLIHTVRRLGRRLS